jgi:hypothetical protein
MYAYITGNEIVVISLELSDEISPLLSLVAKRFVFVL